MIPVRLLLRYPPFIVLQLLLPIRKVLFLETVFTGSSLQSTDIATEDTGKIEGSGNSIANFRAQSTTSYLSTYLPNECLSLSSAHYFRQFAYFKKQRLSVVDKIFTVTSKI